MRKVTLDQDQMSHVVRSWDEDAGQWHHFGGVVFFYMFVLSYVVF